MKTVVYNTFSKQAAKVREKVFVEEQGFQNEFDDIDDRALHIVIFDEDVPVAVCRVFEGEEKGIFILGRLAVIKEYRGKNLGTRMVRAAENTVMENGGSAIALHAQCRVKDFYNKLGFCEYGQIENDEGCPHIWMKKSLP